MLRLTTGIMLLAAPLWCVWAPPAQAQRLIDAASGLSVDPPADYTASRITPQPPSIANFVVQSQRDTNIGCQLVFTPTPDNGRFNQAELNAIAMRPAWRENLIRTFSRIYNIEQSDTFRHAGIDGFAAEGMLRPREGIPPDVLASVRTLLVFLETPNGRTSAVCVGETANFAARRAEFFAIVRTTTPDTRQPAAVRP